MRATACGGAICDVQWYADGSKLAFISSSRDHKQAWLRIALTDPHGAALFNYYACGELKAEGSSVAEGIGQGRITANLEGAPIDDAALQILKLASPFDPFPRDMARQYPRLRFAYEWRFDRGGLPQ